MLFKEAVSKRIYELCDEYNYSPNKLAELSTIPPTNLRRILANEVTNPSLYIIYKICKTLKIDMKEFFDSELFDFDNIND